MFYDNLKAVCDEKGLKITPIVLECGGRSGSIGGWKKGSWPSSEIVVRLAARLDVSTDRLLLGQEKVKAVDEAGRVVRGISDDGLEVAALWDQLEKPDRIMIWGEIYNKLKKAHDAAGADGHTLKQA